MKKLEKLDIKGANELLEKSNIAVIATDEGVMLHGSTSQVLSAITMAMRTLYEKHNVPKELLVECAEKAILSDEELQAEVLRVMKEMIEKNAKWYEGLIWKTQITKLL